MNRFEYDSDGKLWDQQEGVCLDMLDETLHLLLNELHNQSEARNTTIDKLREENEQLKRKIDDEEQQKIPTRDTYDEEADIALLEQMNG